MAEVTDGDTVEDEPLVDETDNAEFGYKKVPSGWIIAPLEDGHGYVPSVHQRIQSIKRDLQSKTAIKADGEVSMKNRDGKYVKAYDYVSHDAVTAFICAELVEHGVNVYPTVIKWGDNGNRIEMELAVKYVNVDRPDDFIEIRVACYGADQSDKGPGKAMSYGLKVAHLKMFGLASWDDQGGEQIDHQTQDKAVERAQEDAAEKVKAGDKRLATTLKQAIDTAPSFDALDGVYKDNKTWLDSMPEPTREYFQGAYSDRLKVLSDESPVKV